MLKMLEVSKKMGEHEKMGGNSHLLSAVLQLPFKARRWALCFGCVAAIELLS